MKAVIFIILLFFLSLSSVSFAWWDPDWHCRVAVNVSYSGSSENATVRTNMNFSSLLNGSFDPNSIRVVEGSGSQYVGYALRVSALVYDAQNPVFGIDPDEITIMFYRTSEQFGLSYWFNVTKNSMTRNSKGFYSYSRNINSSILEGNYLAIMNVSYNSLQKSDITAFRIASAGPFDVSVRSLKSTVSPGEDLTFEINITNAGATDDFDANVTYWIDDGSNYRSSSSVRVFAGTTTILGKIFNILYDEPGGVHVLRVSVAYSSITSPATAETTFTVTEAVTTTTSPAAGGGVTPTTIAKEITKIDIIDYPKEVEVERGWMKYANLKVNNTGSTVLNNIKLSIEGVPSDWLEITPEQIKYLMHDAYENFSLRLAVPVTAKPGNYPINLTVTSKATTSVSSIIRVFSSNAELILFNLETIRNRLSELENATLKAERAGRNVTAIMNMLYEIKDMIRIAEKYTVMNDYDTALAMIRTIKDMLDRAGTELEISQIIVSRPLETSYLLLIIIIIVILIVVIYWLNKRMKLFEKSMKQYIFETKRLVVGRKTVAELQKEKDSIEKMLKILKREYDEGLISKNSYEELKNKNEKRLYEIEKKIGVKA